LRDFFCPVVLRRLLQDGGQVSVALAWIALKPSAGPSHTNASICLKGSWQSDAATGASDSKIMAITGSA
jgi:hypothetical protein